MEDDSEQISVTAHDDIGGDELRDSILDFKTEQQTFVQEVINESFPIDDQPLLSEKIPTSQLKDEYAAEDDIYQNKISELMKRYKFIRRTRRDGNCFYRAFAFGYLERNINDRRELDRFRQLVLDLKNQLVTLGYLELTVEDIRDVVLDTIDYIRQNSSIEHLLERFQTTVYSDYYLAYLRLFTSSYLQMNREFFENFIENGISVKQFCSAEVEPMGNESDNIHIIALTKAAKVPLRVIYMDRNEKTSLTIHDFSATDDSGNEDFQPMITLLYRPGHYDLLYED